MQGEFGCSCTTVLGGWGMLGNLCGVLSEMAAEDAGDAEPWGQAR